MPTFVELPPFERHRESYLNDLEYGELQDELKNNPKAGDVIPGTGGLRKIRFKNKQRGKGKRSGLRIIYYYWVDGVEFLLFSIYAKGETSDLTAEQKKIFKSLLESELKERKIY